jgi:hypothetical protein
LKPAPSTKITRHILAQRIRAHLAFMPKQHIKMLDYAGGAGFLIKVHLPSPLSLHERAYQNVCKDIRTPRIQHNSNRYLADND